MVEAMRPRTDEILKSLFWTFEEYIAPEVTSAYAKSLVLTMNNLFRHVLLRVELEGDLLFEDNRDLRGVLAQIPEFIDQQGDVGGALQDVQIEINALLQGNPEPRHLRVGNRDVIGSVFNLLPEERYD